MASPSISIGDYIWVTASTENEFDIPFGCRCIKQDGRGVTVQDDDDKQFLVPFNKVMKTMHITSIRGVDDMITLGDLQEYSILRNLHYRYSKQLIYTYTGSMLVAVNPYEILPIYTNEQISMYQNKKIGDIPPHIFAIGDSSYRELLQSWSNQCIVISGESGAGKTESTKLILQYIATISGKHSWIEQQIQETNPILESFGNAKTIRNDNSSRFGKYISINFNKKGGIEGAKIEQYLLEKSRIVYQSKGERNYHIFYALLEGLHTEERKRLELGDASGYYYLTGGETIDCEGRNEAAEFSDVRAALKVLNFSDEDTWNIFKLLASILHFGNLKYKAILLNNIDGTEIADNLNATRIASFLGINKSSLCSALTRKTIMVHGEKVVSSLSMAAALESRDSFVKAIYGRIFIKIVEKINDTIHKPDKTNSNFSIGVLDIFGFENFTANSFEQFCINYANENIQQFFVKHIFKMEQEEYAREGINWINIDYVDNQEILDVIGMKPMNIMSLMDEESKFPQGTDLTLLLKLNTHHGNKKSFVGPKASHVHKFQIKHFAGDVDYQIAGFLDKNRDSFSYDVRELIKQSTNEFLQNIFGEILSPNDDHKRAVSLSHQFKTSLEILMKTLSSCHPYFVRCIKPNELKKPKIFDRALCVRQLRYAGMMETTKIRKAGYPIRHTFDDFVSRYRILVTNIPPAHKTDCKEASLKICSFILTHNTDFQIGHTRVFLKDSQDLYLEELRDRMFTKYILCIQTNVRRWIYRRRYLKLKNAALMIQKHWRARGYRSRYLNMRQGFYRLQAILRSRVLKQQLTQMKYTIHRIQAVARAYLVRKMILENKSYIQSNLIKFAKIKAQEEQNFKSKNMVDYKKKSEDGFEKRVKAMFSDLSGNKSEISDYNDTVRSTKKPILDDKYLDLDDVFGFLQDSDGTIREKTPKPVSREDIQDIQNILSAPKVKEEGYEDLSSYNFRKFAATYFLGSINHQYSRRPLKHSLLDQSTIVDRTAARALWVIILRFMGDLPEPKYDQIKDPSPVMAKLSETLGRAFQKSKEFQDIFDNQMYNKQNKMIHMTLKKSQKLNEQLKYGLLEDDCHEFYNTWLNDKRSTNLEKLHFVIGHGLLRPGLRDEIYCQLCKQLSNNPSKASHARGWILMSLCVGCFPPTERFFKFLKSFIRDGPPGYAPFCEGRLNRTMKNGARTQPPSWLELQAVKSKEPVTLTVTFMDSTTQLIKADSASTAEEICGQIASSIGLRDTFGFSVFINLFDKVLSLGSEGEHVMDAISQCEQFAKETGTLEKNAPWKLFFRKEIFTPWHNAADDHIATDLIYHQIIRGVKFGEYRCNRESDIVMLAAQQHYIENGAVINEEEFHNIVLNYIPNHFMQSGETTLNKWKKSIIAAFNGSENIKNKVDILRCKEDIVFLAKLSWPIMFSRFFEAIRIKGASISKNNVIIAVNWTGIYIVDDQEHILLELSFPEITFVGSVKDNNNSNISNFTVITVQKEELVFQSLDAASISNLVIYLIEGLKKRSQFVIAQKDFNHGDSTSFLSFKKGDLITLLNDCNGETIMTSTWGNGEFNGKQGLFPTDQVHIIPAITKPSPDIINLLKKEGTLDIHKIPSKYTTVERKRMHTLQNYAKDHFRPAYGNLSTSTRKNTITSIRKHGAAELWRHTREPIRMPLLEKLLISESLCKEACSAFMAILKYMGDIPSAKAKSTAEYTDQIFDPPMQYEALRDEIYCQIMKQITNNKNQLSEERGWDLMWLITGLFACSQTLAKEVMEFLKTRPHLLAKECLQRFFRTQKVGSRQYPPYIVEVEAIQHRSLEIFHKVYFPDDTDEAFAVDSSTKARDLCEKISERLVLKNSDGFNLFVKVSDKVFSVPENYFFFDFIHELVEWMKDSRPNRAAGAAIQMQYQIFFMKKLWIHSVPGKDHNADQIFYFPQELPKYLRGYHKCKKSDAIILGALIYRAFYGESENQLSQQSNILKQLLPSDVIKQQSMADWKKAIALAHSKDKGKSPVKAKEDFLKYISNWPTFGTAFFEVKQTTLLNYPAVILIGINKNGVNLIHPQSKDILATHPFSELSNWSSGHNYFHMTVGNFMKGSKILCETSLGYKMDDLISSYIAYMKLTIAKK